MDKDTSQAPSHHHNPPLLPKEESPGKSPAPVAGSGGGDRLKRDEWSEGAVSALLEAYESKWVLRNRAKLKGHDWEDVARIVSSRANSTKSPKSQTQCKNKIESMKKRYRLESATADPSSWPLYPRLDMLLRGTTTTLPPLQQLRPAPHHPITNPPPLVLLEPLPLPPPPLTQHPPPGPSPGMLQNLHHRTDGVDRVATKVSDKFNDSFFFPNNKLFSVQPCCCPQ